MRLLASDSVKSPSPPEKDVNKTQLAGVRQLEDQRATIGGEKARINKDMWRTLKGWSRGHVGTPWTLKQVYAEVEADVHHQTAKDTRAKAGHMGPDEVGFGGTTRRREMIPFKRNWVCRSDGFRSSGGDGFSASNGSPDSKSGSMMARSCSSMPALGDSITSTS
jgi:hypothetical protein